MKRSKVLRWFLVAGGAGVLVAAAITVVRPSSPMLIIVLWPASIAGIADPSGWFNRAVFAMLMFGGNFLFYGMFGAIVGFAADRLRNR